MGRIRKEVIGWGAALCAASLLLIAFVPWNINGDWHDAGCCGALAGGVAMLVSLCVDHAGKVGLACLMTVALIFLVANVMHVLDLVPSSMRRAAGGTRRVEARSTTPMTAT